MAALTYEIVESPVYPDHWHVEAIDDEGEVLVAVFSGPDAQRRAAEYSDWKNGVRHPAVVLELLKQPIEVRARILHDSRDVVLILKNLVEQIEKGEWKDSHGHDLRMSVAFHEAHKLLTDATGPTQP